MCSGLLGRLKRIGKYQTMIYIFTYLFWAGFSCLEGFREALFFYVNISSATPINKNLHPMFSTQRGFVLLIIFSSFQEISLLISGIFQLTLSEGFMLILWPLLFVLSCCLLFPILHDGVYYYTRNKLDAKVYPKKFWDQTTTSNAKMNFNSINRIIMFAVSISIIVAMIAKG